MSDLGRPAIWARAVAWSCCHSWSHASGSHVAREGSTSPCIGLDGCRATHRRTGRPGMVEFHPCGHMVVSRETQYCSRGIATLRKALSTALRGAPGRW